MACTIGAMRSSCAWLIGLLAVALAPAVASAQPAAPPTLPVWPGHVERGAVQVDALDVDADALRAVLAPRTLGYVIVTTPRLVSGRVRVAKRAAALAAMIAHEPALAIAPRPMRGGGARVSFDFRGAPTRDLYRVLAQVLNANVVVLAPSVDVTIRVHAQPAKGVLAETARVAGAVIDRPARGVMVVRPVGAPPTPRLPTGGGKLRLVARDVAPGQLVAAVAALDGPSTRAAPACGGGQPVELRLTDVASNTAVALIGLAGQVGVRPPPCALPPLTQAPTPAMRLVATIARGATRVAVVELGGAAAVITDGVDGWEIGDGWASRGGPDADATWRIYGDLEAATAAAPGAAPPRRGTRLAATVIDGATRLAIVEVDGQFQTWIEGRGAASQVLNPASAPPAAFTVAPGEVQIQGGATLRLAPRVP